MKRSQMVRLLTVGVFLVLFLRIEIERGTSCPTGPLLPSPHGRIGIYLTSYALLKPGVLDKALQAVEAGRLNALVINVKNNLGEVTYASRVSLAKEIGASTRRLNLASLLPTLRAKGIYLIARQVVFYDPKFAAYLGDTDSPWVPPNDRQAVQYNLAIAQEVASLGFDELQFDYLRFPDEGPLIPSYEDHYQAVNQFLQQARQLLSGKITLSVDVFGRVLWDWNKKRIDPIGQSLEDMTTYVDLISPMLYPSHYNESYYQQDPYRVVQEALSCGKARVTTPYRPFLQAFDRAVPAGMRLEDYIRAQIRAAQDAGADGYLFWDPSCDYTALYKALD